MKFKFCSDGDCPLWALAGLNYAAALPPEVLKGVLNMMMDENSQKDSILDIMEDNKISVNRDDCARLLSVLRWVLRQTWGSKCEGSQLTRDLLVLGVSRTHADILAEAADKGRIEYEAHIKKNPIIINRVSQVTVEEAPDTVLNSVMVQIGFTDPSTGKDQLREVILNKDQVPGLLVDMKRVYDTMTEL